MKEEIKKIKFLETVISFLMFLCVFFLVFLQLGSNYLQKQNFDLQQLSLFSRLYWEGKEIGSISVRNQPSPLLRVDVANLAPNEQFELVLLESVYSQEKEYFVYNPSNARQKNCYYERNQNQLFYDGNLAQFVTDQQGSKNTQININNLEFSQFIGRSIAILIKKS